MNKSRSLSGNLLANYVSQIYITLLGIVMVPLYLKYMGAEAYGLVGFFAMLQAWFNLLDMGLTPTMARETARFRGGATEALSYRRLVRALEGMFLVVALAGGGTMFAASGYIASGWLQAAHLPIAEVQRAVHLMAVIVAIRWMCGLYRGAISGSERLVWLGGYNACIATLRFIGVLPVLIFVGATPTIFFSYHCGVAALELAGLLFQAYGLLPSIPQGKRLPWSWVPLKPVLKFSLTIAFTSSVWVLVTQTDKLVLSKLLPLAEYGYFTLAVLVAGGVMVISGPISGAIMPRMAKLEAEGDYTGLIRVYRQSTQLVAVIAGAAAVTVVFCAEPLLWAWTGDKILAHQAAPMLILYAIGNGILAVSAFPYYLQYAKGDLRLHLIGNAVFVVLLVPAIIWAASQYGGVGAGYVWLVMNLISFVAWLPLVHRKFAPGLNLKWYVQDILTIFVVAGIVGYCLYTILPHSDSRGWQIGAVMGFGLLVMMAASVASTFIRESFCVLVTGTSNGKRGRERARMIDLDAPGVIIFFGTMNAMPMMYAHELRNLGQDVIYFVDVPEKNALCRPENHFPYISYPYPDWVVEFVLPTQLIANVFPKLTLLLMLRKAKRKKKFDTVKAVFLGGSFISYAPFFKEETLKIFLSYGSDFDNWCNTQNTSALSWGMKRRSVFKFFPYVITKALIKSIVRQNLESAKSADVLLYFPRGMNKIGDRLISELENAGVTYIPRYDISFEPLKYANREFKPAGKKLVIFSVVRFLYKTFPEPNEEYSKGNDKIIYGLAMYKKFNKNIEIHFVEKGEDVHHAKLLCDELGLSDVVVWHKEMTFKELIRFYELADICFDQVGKHWVGAGGIYALYIGRPLIANARNLSFLGESPIMNAETPDEVCKCMVALSDLAFRKTISTRSKKFAEEKLGPFAVLERLVLKDGHSHSVPADTGR